MPRKGEIVQSSLFGAGTDHTSKTALLHSDVGGTHEEAIPGDAQQETLVQPDAIPARRSALPPVQHVPSEPLNSADLTQIDLFGETEQVKIRTIEDCFVTMKPIVDITQKTEYGKTTKREEWKCTFTSPPDLWHMDNPAIIHVSAIDPETIKRAKAAKLQRGNYVTITGRVKSES